LRAATLIDARHLTLASVPSLLPPAVSPLATSQPPSFLIVACPATKSFTDGDIHCCTFDPAIREDLAVVLYRAYAP